MANTKNNYSSDYDAAAEEARRREEERKRRIAELEQQIAALNAEREKYYQAREKTVEAINTLDQMAESLDEAVSCLHENFRINGVNADKGELDTQIEEITGTAKILKNSTLPDMNTNIDNLSKQINSAISELNGLHTGGESLYPEDVPKNLYDDGTINAYNTGTRSVSGDGKTYLNYEVFTQMFTEIINSANSELTNATGLVNSIIETVPSSFGGIGTLKGLGTNFTDISTKVGKIYANLITQAAQIAQIEATYSSKLSALETNLSGIYTTGGIKEFTASISNLFSTGEMNAAALTTIVLPNLVRQGKIDVSQLGSITADLYSNKIIDNSGVGNIIYELKRTNLNYAVTADNMSTYQEELNNTYGYKFSYTEHYDNNKNNCWFKIDSEYEYKTSDINEILLPMYKDGTITTDDIKEITQSVTIFDKETGSPDVYNNQQYSPHTKSYDDPQTNGKFQVTIGNISYEVTDKDRELIQGVKGYEDLFTDDEAYNEAIADVAISDFAVAITTKEIGSINTAVDEANAVASVAINRTESSYWTQTDEQGGGLVAQYIREGQYQTYNQRVEDGWYDGYLEYINGKGYQTVEAAATDAMNGTRVTDAISFSIPEELTAENKITQGDGNTFTYSVGKDKMADPVADKLPEYKSTGQVYKRVVQPNETLGTATFPVSTPNQEKTQITEAAYQEITTQATELANATTTNSAPDTTTTMQNTQSNTSTNTSTAQTITETNASPTNANAENNSQTISSTNYQKNSNNNSFTTYKENTFETNTSSNTSSNTGSNSQTFNTPTSSTENITNTVTSTTSNDISNPSNAGNTYQNSLNTYGAQATNSSYSQTSTNAGISNSSSTQSNTNLKSSQLSNETNTNTYNSTNTEIYQNVEETQKSPINLNTILDEKADYTNSTNTNTTNNINNANNTGNNINTYKETTQATTNNTNTNNNKINLSGLLFGSSILTGLGFGGKKIYDKKQKKDDDEK